ncbi:MAG TPA: hypothetical protein PLG34_05240 [Spirochaetota bacterium]|nr:MAG: hypothetical protein BWX91_01354 [Spirochaetes bacterium ADurb.Bin133]HNZ26156.1 hypothetical protein [Spirochaetota bacterium]HPY87368.1 hypothetical protein [Spirochaetota bacterium]
MKEKFLNVFLFLISITFIGLGIILMFFSDKILMLTFVVDGINAFIDNPKVTGYFMSLFGSIVFTWGIFFFLLTVFTVMELKNNNVYGFIFWGFTFWIASSGVVTYLHKFYFMLIILGVLYGILFLPYLFSLPMKGSSTKN